MSDYPTEEHLQFIRDYDINQGPDGMIKHLQKIWYWLDFVKTCERKTETHNEAEMSIEVVTVLSLELHTGGWSGNEDIIEALAASMFWLMYWQKSVRNGHYYFEILDARRRS